MEKETLTEDDLLLDSPSLQELLEESFTKKEEEHFEEPYSPVCLTSSELLAVQLPPTPVYEDFIDDQIGLAYSDIFIPKKEIPPPTLYENRHPKNRIIKVEVPTEDGHTKKQLNVELDYSELEDMYFIGGFRHIPTDVYFYNAQSQTEEDPPERTWEQSERETQTYSYKKKVVNAEKVTKSTQLFPFALHVFPDYTGKLLGPSGKYLSADQIKAILMKKILFLQRCWRRWLARRRLKRLVNDIIIRQRWEREHGKQKDIRLQRELCLEASRIASPKHMADFDLIFSDLEQWRKRQIAKLNEQRTGAERKAGLCGLLDKEGEIITNVNFRRINLLKEHNEQFKLKYLIQISKPKFFRSYRNLGVDMDTLETQHARKIMELYSSLMMDFISKDERIDTLTQLIALVKCYNTPLTKEIVALAEREIHLIHQNIRTADLQGLKTRIQNAFWQLVRDPLFNPESKHSTKRPSDSMVYRKCMSMCMGCMSYFQAIPSSDAQTALHASSGRTRCKNCLAIYNEAVKRQNLSLFQVILDKIRDRERGLGTTSGVAFFMQKTDIAYLVEKIWGGQSALSGQNDLHLLALPRWESKRAWMPWNTILMSEEEAESHANIESPQMAYRENFISRIEQRNRVAKTYFSSLQTLKPLLSNYIYYPKSVPQRIPGVKNPEVPWAHSEDDSDE